MSLFNHDERERLEKLERFYDSVQSSIQDQKVMADIKKAKVFNLYMKNVKLETL